MGRWTSFLVVAGLSVILTSCTELAAPAGPVLSDQARLRVSTLDDEFARMAELAPGFGGLYFDYDTLVVRSTGRSTEDALRAAIRTVSDPAGIRGVADAERQGRIQFQGADFEFRDLLKWKAQLRGAIRSTEPLGYDADEFANRVRVQAASRDLAALVVAKARALGIPDRAVVVDVAETRPAKDLRDAFRPVPGAVQVSPGACTATANANTSDGMGFITASHCTAEFADDSDSTTFLQPGGFLWNAIGKEYLDPPLWPNGWAGCNDDGSFPEPPVGCRFSDAAFIKYTNASNAQHGEIARTLHYYGSLEINNAIPTFYVADGGFGSLAVGRTVYKVGRTTGWTRGTVRESCVDYQNWDDHVGVWLLCQTQTDAVDDFGDSGSPVFTMEPDGESVVLWGVIVSVVHLNGQFYRSGLSLWMYVEFEIGELLGGLGIIYGSP